jgi:F-type H+-transporting ATPase subunit b
LIEVNFSALVIIGLVFALVLILERLFFEPLAGAMEARRERSESAERLWSETSRQVDSGLATLREVTGRARSEGYQELDRVRAQAQAERARQVDGQRQAALEEIGKAREALRQQAARAVEQLEGEADRLAVEIASRLLGRSVV